MSLNLEIKPSNHSNNPVVSILMTVYNREKYISEAIESVLASTYTDFELIIADDSSTDRSLAIANEYAANDARIKVRKNEQNLGDYPNRNHASTYATGKYIMYVDSDDTLNQDAIEYIMQQFTKYPEARFATIYQQQDIKSAVILSSKESIHKHFFIHHFLDNGPGGSIIERNYFNSIGKFPTTYGSANDMYYNIKAAINSPIILLPYVYLYWRRHEGQEVHDGYPYLYNNYRYMEDVLLLTELPITLKERKKLLLQNKRRLIVHSLVYLKNTGAFGKFFKAYKLAGIGFNDVLRGVFYV